MSKLQMLRFQDTDTILRAEVSESMRVEYYYDLRRIVVGWGDRGEVTMRLFHHEAPSGSPSQTPQEYVRYYWARQFDAFDSTIINKRAEHITPQNQIQIWKDVFHGPTTEEFTVKLSFYKPTRRVCIADTFKGEPVWASWRIWFIDYQPRPIPIFWRSAHSTARNDLIAYIDDELDKATLSVELQCFDDHSWKEVLVSTLAKKYGINNTPPIPLELNDLMNEISRAYMSNQKGQSRRQGLQLVPSIEQEIVAVQTEQESLRRAGEEGQSSSDERTEEEDSE